MTQWPYDYHTLPVRKGGLVDRYVSKLRETDMCTFEEALEKIILILDPDQDFIEKGGE